MEKIVVIYSQGIKKLLPSILKAFNKITDLYESDIFQ